MALKNAISLIRQIKPPPPPKPTSGTNNGHPGTLLSLWLAFGVFGLAAGGGALQGRGVSILDAIRLLNEIMVLQPIAFDLVLKFAQSLKGKTTAEVLVMNESLFDKIDRVVQEELAKLDNPPKS